MSTETADSGNSTVTTEQATLALMVLKLCREKGWAEKEVMALFSRRAIRHVYAGGAA